MERLTYYLSCGNKRQHPCLDRDTGGEFIVTKFSSIVDIIIPFFQKYPILGVKAIDFFYFLPSSRDNES